jgi:hypothetical protein
MVKYRMHRLDVKMARDQARLEQFVNGLAGETVAIIPNVAWGPCWVHRVDFLFGVERTG